MIASSVRAGGERSVRETVGESGEQRVLESRQVVVDKSRSRDASFPTQRCRKVEGGRRLLMNTLLQGSVGRRREFAQSGSTINE